MNDIKLFLDNAINEGISPKLENGDLVADDGLETAVIISLFSDRRITDDQLPLGQISKRGWWGDLFSEVDQDLTGSRFWILQREKRITATLRRFEDYAKEALAWMVEDGVAASVTAVASYNERNYLFLDIVIKKPKGNSFNYRVNWDSQLIIRG